MIEQQDPLQSVFEAITEMKEDSTIPRNIKLRLTEIEGMLNSEGDLTMHVNKALGILDEVSDDVNLQSYTRMQLLNIVSMLETIC